MSLIKDQSGFTLTEIIVALLIMMVGFLAMSQMQFLSLRQHHLAESGTVGTNFLQALSERDMSEVRRLHLLNAHVYLDGQRGLAVNSTQPYCDGGTGDPCLACPCDPLTVITSNTGADNTETSCATIDLKNVDPTQIEYHTTKTDCSDAQLYIVRRVITDVDNTVTPNEIHINVTYAVMDSQQFEDYSFGDQLDLPNSIVLQNYEASAHIDNWSSYVIGWNQVVVPHVP